jgi:large subunit ribosomal protein L1
MPHGKRYRDLYARVDRERAYPPAEAIRLIKELQSGRFTETVECHVRTGLNVRHADEQLRGTLTFPHGLGREVTVAVFAKGDNARDAQEAGADHVGDDELAARVEEGFTNFDVAIATPDMMPTVGRLGRILGPQGKMPNPKVGTVTPDIRQAVEEAKAGKVEYRTDRSAIVDELIRAKPAAAKGRYLRTITLATTMGPGVRVDPARTRDIIEEIKEEGADEATAAAAESAEEPAPVA